MAGADAAARIGNASGEPEVEVVVDAADEQWEVDDGFPLDIGNAG